MVLAVLLLALLVTPLLVGAAAPVAIRALAGPTPVPASEAVAHAYGVGAAGSAQSEPEAETRPSPADTVHGIETLASPTSHAARAQPAQSWRASDVPPGRGERLLAAPTLRPADAGWVARRLEIPALGIDVRVAMAASAAEESFPPHAGAYILRSSSQPGRGTNSYLFAHAMPDLFKPLWWARPGQQVIVTMSDGQQLGYRVTAIVRDIPCPDPTKPKPAGLPPVLANATECDLQWTRPTPTERLTMQTSQGFNRNYGAMVVIAEPEW
jgi:hypothetical protein